MKEKLKVGVIGVGHLGGYHAQKYAAIPAVDLVGVADTDDGRVNEARLSPVRNIIGLRGRYSF